MFTLYGGRGLGSAAVEAVLEEAGAAYTAVEVDKDAAGTFPDWFVALNPMAQVPVLVLPDGRVMTESAAILIHLADSFPGAALAPAPGDAGRPDYLRWMIFIAANLYKTDLRIYYPARYCDDAQAAGAVKAAAGRQLVREWEIYADALGEKPFMLGERLSAVDIYAALQATWHPDVPALFAKHPNIKAMCQRVTARPSVAKVWARHGL